MRDAEEAVWITGVGLATPLGCDLPTLEANLLAGKSGIAAVSSFPTDDYPSRIAAQLSTRPLPIEPGPGEFSAPAAPGAGGRVVRRGRAQRRRLLGRPATTGASGWCWGSGPNGCSSGKRTRFVAAAGSPIPLRTASRRSTACGAGSGSRARP